MARRARLDLRQELAEVTDARRELGCPLGPRGVVAEDVAELLQMRPAARAVDDHRLDAVERLDHLPRERAALVAAAGVHGEGAAASLRRRDDLVAVRREDARGRRVDRPEHDRLHAAGQDPDAAARLAVRRRRLGGLLGRAPRRCDLGHRPEPSGERDLAAEWSETQGGAHPARVGQQLEQRPPHEAVPERARHLVLDPLAGRRDQEVVLDAGGAGGHAGEAAEAAVEVLRHGRVERQRPVEIRLHQLDPAPRRVHLLVPDDVRGAGGEAEAAVDALGRERAEVDRLQPVARVVMPEPRSGRSAP